MLIAKDLKPVFGITVAKKSINTPITISHNENRLVIPLKYKEEPHKKRQKAIKYIISFTSMAKCLVKPEQQAIRFMPVQH
jgi:hypothetical protein